MKISKILFFLHSLISHLFIYFRLRVWRYQFKKVKKKRSIIFISDVEQSICFALCLMTFFQFRNKLHSFALFIPLELFFEYISVKWLVDDGSVKTIFEIFYSEFLPIEVHCSCLIYYFIFCGSVYISVEGQIQMYQSDPYTGKNKEIIIKLNFV